MKLSARNVLRGTIVEVIKGQTTAHVRLDIKGAVVTASITNEAVDDLGLKKGMAAAAIIKASEGIVAVDCMAGGAGPPDSLPRSISPAFTAQLRGRPLCRGRHR